MKYFIAFVLLIAGGVAHGLMTDRWNTSQSMERAVAKLDRIPLDFGDWKGTDVELEKRHIKEGEIDGYLARKYVNRISGETVSIALVCGRPGPISVHTPDLCYVAAGYKFASPPARRLVTVAPNTLTVTPEVWVASVTKERSALEHNLRLGWCWSSDGAWKAPDHPRITFAMAPALYKLYVVREISSVNEPIDDDDPIFTFIDGFTRNVNKELFSLSDPAT